MKNIEIGFVIFVEKFDKCIEFYSNILELEVLFTKKDLVCYKLSNIYLLVEKAIKGEENSHSYIRVNVEDVSKKLDFFKDKNIKYDYNSYNWGELLKIKDPSGNYIGFRDKNSFERQLKEYILKEEK